MFLIRILLALMITVGAFLIVKYGVSCWTHNTVIIKNKTITCLFLALIVFGLAKWDIVVIGDIFEGNISSNAKVICPTCKGSGKCFHCDGTGTQTLKGEEITCQICEGTKKCYVCEGKKKITQEQLNQHEQDVQEAMNVAKRAMNRSSGGAICTTCNGTGRTNNKCIACNGTGIDSLWESTKGRVIHVFTKEVCSSCNGTGYKPCKDCGGDGIK